MGGHSTDLWPGALWWLTGRCGRRDGAEAALALGRLTAAPAASQPPPPPHSRLRGGDGGAPSGPIAGKGGGGPSSRLCSWRWRGAHPGGLSGEAVACPSARAPRY